MSTRKDLGVVVETAVLPQEMELGYYHDGDEVIGDVDIVAGWPFKDKAVIVAPDQQTAIAVKLNLKNSVKERLWFRTCPLDAFLSSNEQELKHLRTLITAKTSPDGVKYEKGRRRSTSV
jgi:hypothetical protein